MAMPDEYRIQEFIAMGLTPEEAAIKLEGYSTEEAIRIAAGKSREDAVRERGGPLRENLFDNKKRDGLLKKEYQLDLGQFDASGLEGYQKYKEQALSDDASPWAKLMEQKLAQEEANQRSEAAAQNMAGQAQARSSLAMRGGLSAGARERIAQQGQRNLMNTQQGIQSQGLLNKYNLGAQDQQNRMGMLKDLSGSEIDIGKYNVGLKGRQGEYNIGQALEEKRYQSGLREEDYVRKMKQNAADERAAAIAAEGNVKQVGLGKTIGNIAETPFKMFGGG